MSIFTEVEVKFVTMHKVKPVPNLELLPCQTEV